MTPIVIWSGAKEREGSAPGLSSPLFRRSVAGDCMRMGSGRLEPRGKTVMAPRARKRAERCRSCGLRIGQLAPVRFRCACRVLAGVR